MTQPGAILRTIEVDGRELRFQYMTPRDAEALLAFARSFSQHDLLFLPTDITSVEGVNEWVDGVLLGQVGVILAFEGDTIVGYSSVIRHTPLWMRHIAEIGVLVAEPLRRHGVGSELTKEAFVIASDLGIRRMLAQMTLDQHAAIQMFRRLGFSPLAILPQHVADQDGETYDLVVMHQDVAQFEETLRRLDVGG
jgi:L-amino acid N-acyltransferase YncA